MTFLDPRTGEQVNIIDLAAERLKRASDPFKNDPPPIQSDPGDETDYKPFKGPPGTVEGTRDNV